MAAPLRLGALASGRGSNLHAIQRAIDRRELSARFAVVISNNSDSGALAFAREHGAAAVHVSAKTHADPGTAMLEALHDAGVELLVLAGYMKLLDPVVVRAYAGRALNIHPGPLPGFGGPGMYGLRVHEAVLAAGVSASAATVHRVTSEYDEGEVVGVRPVAVLPGDTPEVLAARVLEAEHDLYWRVIADEGTRLRARAPAAEG